MTEAEALGGCGARPNGDAGADISDIILPANFISVMT
jgi:hypothetical protein